MFLDVASVFFNALEDFFLLVFCYTTGMEIGFWDICKQ